MAESRKTYIDVAKGIAMVWIISVHADGAPYTGTVGYVLLIPLFFLTAGFLWKEREQPSLTQLQQRARPLLRPYFGYNLALMGLYILDWLLKGVSRTALLQILKRCFGVFYSEGVIWMDDATPSLHFFTVYNYPLWFLTAMVTASGAFLLLLWLRRRMGWQLKWLILPCLGVTVLLNCLPLRLPWNLNNCFLAAALMAAGMGLRQVNLLERTWKRLWTEVLFWGLAAGAVLAIGIWNDAMSTSMLMSLFGPHGKWGVGIYFVGGVTGAAVLLRLCRFLRGGLLERVFSEIGRNTIPVLALHRTLITYYNRLWNLAIGAQPSLHTPAWFAFSVPRLVFAAAGSMGLVYFGRFIKRQYNGLRQKTADQP